MNVNNEAVKKAGKIMLIVIVVILVVWGGLKIKDMLSVMIKQKSLTNEVNKEMDVSQITLTHSQYNTLANKIFSAKGVLNDDEEAVYDAFKTLNTRTDVLQLMSAFGVKDDMTLSEYLYDMMSAKEIAKINNILASKSINYTF